MIEALALTFAQYGGLAGIFLFGCFVIVILSMLTIAYIALKILASVHDDKETKYKIGEYPERRTEDWTPKHGLIIKIVRWMRKAK